MLSGPSMYGEDVFASGLVVTCSCLQVFQDVEIRHAGCCFRPDWQCDELGHPTKQGQKFRTEDLHHSSSNLTESQSQK